MTKTKLLIEDLATSSPVELQSLTSEDQSTVQGGLTLGPIVPIIPDFPYPNPCVGMFMGNMAFVA